MYPDAFIKEIPKTDLHVHLDGSLRINTLIELAKKNKVEMPSYTETGLREKVFKDKYNNLAEYLKGFYYTVNVLRTAESLAQVAYEMALDSISDGVRYIEVRFAPQLHISDNLSFEGVLNAVNDGLKKAEKEYNSTEGVKTGDVPPFHYGIIVCALRFFMPGFSPYYSKFSEIHKYSTKDDIFKMASLELAKATVKFMHEQPDIPIVGFDLAGQENGYPAVNHKDAYAYCHQNFLRKTVHAGEAYGAESIFQAITVLHADRIGHGFYLFDTGKIQNPDIQDKKRYIQKLSQYIANNRTTIEVCLTSNMQTNPEIKDIKKHTLGKMLKNKISITFCTDNLLHSNTNVSKEIRLAVDNFSIPPQALKNIIIYGFKRNFFFGSYNDKRQYCRQVIDYYEKIEDRYNMRSAKKM